MAPRINVMQITDEEPKNVYFDDNEIRQIILEENTVVSESVTEEPGSLFDPIYEAE